jgi:hypothetical protein
MTALEMTPPAARPSSTTSLDAVLTAQLAVAWAGETGEAPRLKWWRTDLVSEFGGEDLFRRLMPHTWRWAVLEGAREAARRRDVELRAKDADPDRILTLFRLGFAMDERLNERLADLKRGGSSPAEALPGLRDVITEAWSKAAFADWVAGHGEVDVVTVPTGRRLKGDAPASIELLVKKLVAALHPLADAYPMPHARQP